jgi:hypothetical protein
MPLAAGTMLGRYENLASAGSGGMGDVYRAQAMADSLDADLIEVDPIVVQCDENAFGNGLLVPTHEMTRG